MEDKYYECVKCHHLMAVRIMRVGFNEYNCEHCGASVREYPEQE